MGLQVVLRKEIAKAMRNALLAGEYLPGERVPLEVFCKKMEVSLTPVQDAALILEQEGMVVLKPRSGVYVRTFTREEIVDLLRLEGVTEGLAASMAASRITARQLESLEKLQRSFLALPNPDAKGFRTYDRKFHAAIVKSSRSKVLIELIEKQMAQVYLSRYYTATVPGRIQHSLEEHARILGQLMERDAEGVERAIRGHIDSSVRDFLAED